MPGGSGKRSEGFGSMRRTFEADMAPEPTYAKLTLPTQRNKVFLAHGHDATTRMLVERFIEKMGLETIVLANQPGQSMTIIEKFEKYAAEVNYAVIVITPDDVGGLQPGLTANAQQERARQNVIFELGFFVGRLGRGKICLLRKGNVEMPSDLHGVSDISIGEGSSWSFKLADELRAAEIIQQSNAYGACRALLCDD
jgi:predicted nucleotide-binding protein